MSTNSQSPDSALDELRLQLGKDNADAVAKFVDNRVVSLRSELTDLVKRQKDNLQQAKASNDPEAKKAANAANASLRDASQAVQAAKGAKTPAAAQAASEKVEKAAQAVDEVDSVLTGRVDAIEATLAPWREGEKLGDRAPSRFDPIEQDMARIGAQVDQAAMAYAKAEAIARSAVNRPNLWLVGAVTFVVAFAIAGVWAMFSSLSIFWDAFWLAAGTTAFVVVSTWLIERLSLRRQDSSSDAEAEAHAEAEAEARAGASVN